VQSLAFLFIPGTDSYTCFHAVDANADLVLDIGDSIHTLAWLFVPGSPPPPTPGPETCGAATTPPVLSLCLDYQSCP